MKKIVPLTYADYQIGWCEIDKDTISTNEVINFTIIDELPEFAGTISALLSKGAIEHLSIGGLDDN